MTVPASPATVTLTIPVHPTPEHHQVLLRRAQLQRQVRREFWSYVRSGLKDADPAQTWPQPKVLLPAIADGLYDLTDSNDQEGRAYIDATLLLEVGRLRRLPARVDLHTLQPESSAEQLSVPCPLALVGRDTLLLPGLDLEVGYYALPQPFRSVLLHAGAERLQACWAQVQSDFSTWDREWGDVSATMARQFQVHAEQAGRWCPGPGGGAEAVPGVKLVGAVLHRRPDQTGNCRWACDLSFSLAPDAVRDWFPAAGIDVPVGIDPGLMHPLTWASGGTGKSLDPALINLAGFPGGQGAGARVVRQAAWERHAVGYDRVWAEVLRHRVIRVEDTHWETMLIDNPDFPARARDNYLWVWLDHLVALAPLSGSNVEWIASKDTSIACSECGYVNAERQQLTFRCTSPVLCSYSAPVDINAALNVAQAMVPRRALIARSAALRQPA